MVTDIDLLFDGLRLKLDDRNKRLLLNRLRLNPHIVENPYWFLPIADDGHGEYVQAGRGGVSRESCGEFKGRIICFEKLYHSGVTYKDVDYTDKNVVMNSHYWCHKTLCIICFISGFAVRNAKGIEGRIDKAVERGYGVPEHIVLSPPKSLRELSFSELFKLGWVVAKDRGVKGGCLIAHGRRINRELRMLSWSPHIHTISFIAGSFDRCRSCSHSSDDCKSCDGFKGRQIRGFKKDGWIVKVEPKRESVFGTAYYVLHHVTTKVGVRRFHALRWVGSLSNCSFKGGKIKSAVLCPVCKLAGHRSEMVSGNYWGRERLSSGKCHAVPDFDNEGRANFPDSERGDRFD